LCSVAWPPSCYWDGRCGGEGVRQSIAAAGAFKGDVPRRTARGAEEGGSMRDPQVTLAFLGGWSLVVVFVLTVIIGALVRSRRLLILLLVNVELLLLFWVFTLWWVAA
jgi:hypothetical protein